MDEMDLMDVFVRFGVALAVGLMIGLERGWSGQQNEEHANVGGLRTFGLMSLLGALWSLLATALNHSALLGFGFLALAGLLTRPTSCRCARTTTWASRQPSRHS
jgi:uncharacterized membrane protein YhiD involved in acid resistance